MANVLFKLRQQSSAKPQPIYLVYWFGSKERIFYPTGLKINPKYWNDAKMRVRDVIVATDKDVINSRLNELQSVTETHIIELKARGKNLSKEILRKFLDDYTNNVSDDSEKTFHGFVSVFLEENKTRTNPNGKLISYKVIREHERTYQLIKDFEDKRNKGIRLNFEDITFDFHADFTNYLQSLNLSVNTIAHKFQTLKTWLNEATERNINTNNQYKNKRFKVVLEENEDVYLSDDELMQVYNFNDMSDSLIRVRDLFLIGAYTGLRFSDFTSITADNIKDGKLHIEQQKTGKPVTIPLHPIVIDIWKKYDANLPKVISNQKFNEYIKDVCRLAGINSNEQKGITKGGKRVKQTYKKYELVSSHTARRSFATNLYLDGVSTLTIMQITGHKTESAFMKYIKVSREQHADLLQTHWAKTGSLLSVVNE
ncbi:MAG: site-specific integrase [Dysgonamonadaceae bacterium]|jgi:integrase|nr:site-specific integrase [Dysgonamonadaceae bacterium]